MGIKTAQLWLGGGWKLERKSPGAFRSVWELPVLEPSHREHKGGEEKQVQQDTYLLRRESRGPVPGWDDCCWPSWRPSSCSPQTGNPRRVLRTQHTRTPQLCVFDGPILVCTTTALNKRPVHPLLALAYTKVTQTFQKQPQKGNKNCSLDSRFRCECS